MLAISPAQANQPLTLEEVLHSSLRYFPEIEKAKAKRQASEASVQEALGAFDASLNNETHGRIAGFYDGKYSSTKITKPLQEYNARVSAGYRVSDGSFPIYDDYYYTNSGGEFNLELFLSLLRDRDIDDERLSLWNNRLNVTKAGQEQMLAKIGTQHAAMRAYYEWVAAGEMLKIQENLLNIAQDRQKGLKIKASHGDIAAVTETENSQYIYRRQGLLNDAKRLYANAAANLSLYLRDAQGEMISPGKTHFSRFPHHDNLSIELQHTPEKVFAARPEFSIIEADIEREKNNLKAGENKLLPRVDLMAKTARDTGDGSSTRRNTEQIIGVNISIPLQNNAAKGSIAKAEANLKALEAGRMLLRNKLTQQLQYIENNYQAAKQAIEFSRQEVDVAKKMQKVERHLFDKGGSDYFLLNMREEQLANAESKNIGSKLQLYQVLADYYAATVKLDKLQIN
jgi:outer membrane protein TolC